MLNVNPQVRKTLTEKKELQFKWKSTINNQEGIFAHILYDYETSPLSLHVSDDESKPVKASVETFRDYVTEMSKHYNTKNLLLMIGSGLNFEKAEFFMSEIDQLIAHINNSTGKSLKLHYSTLSQYT
jgi:hypothetical protein